MQTQFLFVVLFCFVAVWGQIDHISDPGLLSIAENQCATDAAWWFRADYSWNQTDSFVDAQCQIFLQLPTDFRSGVTKGNQTAINHFVIPALPEVTGSSNVNFTSSAGVVDMNAPCRSSLWAPFTLENDNATVTLEYTIWVGPLTDSTTQYFISGSYVPDANELQYLDEPDGLLQQDNSGFPVTEDIVNQIRVDIILPDSSNSFYDSAFSIDPSVIAMNFPIPGFDGNNSIPLSGTNSAWMPVSQNATLPSHGNYALRFSSAHSVIGATWGVTDVHLIESGGTPPANNTVTPLPWDLLIENAAQTVGGTLTIYKTALLPAGTVRNVKSRSK